MAEQAIPRDLYITHVDKDGPLIRIYAQTDKKNALYIERMLYLMRETLDTADLKPKTRNDIKLGLICCAKFEDGVYYRARIIDTTYLHDYKITVFFIDHGNVAYVHVTDIKLLDKLKAVSGTDMGATKLMELGGLAEAFYLGGVAPKCNNQWDDDTVEILRQALCNKDGLCTIHIVGEDKILNFCIPDADPAKLLISSNKGLPLPQQHLEDYLRTIRASKVRNTKTQSPIPQHINTSLPPPRLPSVVQPLPQARFPNLSQPPPARISNETIVKSVPNQNITSRHGGVHVRPGIPGMQIRRSESSISSPASGLQFSTDLLTPGVTHRVFVSHVEDGPCAFAVQLQNVVEEVLSKMMLDLSNIQPQPITAPLNPGSICIGRYSGDKTLCRAIVMNVMDDKVKLYFADFGSSEVLPFSEVYQIPAQFVTPKVMSHRFTLANIKNVVYSEQEKKMFKDLVANARDLMLTVTPPEANPLKQYCELYLHCKNIKTIMEELSQAQQAYIRYQPVSAPLKGSQEKVFVSYVVNPGRFFVQLDKNDYSLKQVMKYVSDHCTRAPHVPLSNQRPGEPCCALFDDGIWYRAEIIKLTTDNKAFINFVDFGNEEEIDLTNLRQISPELVKSLKAQAVLCSLTGYENRYNVDEEISNRLEELVLEHKLIMHVEDCVEMPGQLKKLIVKLIDSRGVDISSQLEVKPTYTTPTSSEYADGGWEDKQATSPQNNNSWGQSDEKKPWRSREDGETGAKFNRDENRSGRFNRDEESSGRFNRDRGGSNRFGDDDKGGKFNRDSDSRGGGRFSDDRGERSNTEGGSGRFNRDSDSKGGRFNEEKGTKFSKSDDDKSPWRKKDDDSTGGIKSKREDAGGWKPRGDRESGGGWKSREEGGGSGGWKSREEGGGGGGWKSRDEGSGGGSWKSREEGGGGGGWKSREEGSGGGGGWKSREEGGGGGGWKSRGEGGGGGGGWKSREDGGGGGGWKSREEGGGGGGWKSREEGGGGGGWKSREEGGGGGGWKSREEGGGGWKSRDGGGGGWKSREEGGGSGGWKSREEGGGGGGWKSRDGNRFDGERRGGFNRDSDSRSSYRKPWDSKGDGSASKSPKPDTVGGMPHSPVKVGQTDTVEVCFTTSPLNFYIQLSNTFEELTQLMDKIATGCDSGDISDMTDVQEKSGCLAKYSEDDSWYRAVVLEKTFDSVKVLFVDYGNEESVTLDKIKTLPEDMSTLSVQAIKCRLLGVPETAEAEPFKALAEGKPLKAQFVSRNFLSKSFEVVLVDEETNTNINIVMGASEESVQSSLSKMGSLVPIPLKYPVGTTINTQMTWYLSPSQFYLQPMTSNPEFRAMMQAMQAVVRSGTIKQNNDLNIGDFVIARFKADKVLYRAVVQECGFVPKVQYVDYGNVEVVDSGSVWAMEQEYATLPIQAINCCLAGVQPTGETWPSPNSTALDSHFEAETLDCSVLKELDGEGGQQYLVKLVKQGDDVAQKIIEAGLAVAGPDAVGALSELDTSLIVGQTLPVTFLRVQEDYTLYVQPASEEVELQSLELEAGQGVKCVLSNVKETATDEAREALTQLPGNTYIILLVDAVQSEGLQVTLFDGEGQLLALQENEVQSVEKVCPMPILNMHQKVWIAHASEDGIFLHKVMFADLLAELLQKLYDFYNESEPVEQEWSNGNLCCAKSVSDEQWYRAKILETGEETKVQYIDYGNTEIIPINNLRQLDASFYTPHALALLVSLHVTWTVPVENLMELAGETEYNAVILRNKTGWIAEFVDNSGQSLTEKLVELGFATALENSPFKRIVEGGRFAEGSVIPITVSFVDSPLQLWIHVGDDIELIEALQDRLQEAASKLLPLKEATGIFAAKFSDGLWYRALKLDDTSVRFIDYGNSDVVDMTDIKALSPDFLDPAEGYAVKVELPVVDFEEGTNEKLEDLLISSEIDKEEEVIARILSVKENSIVADIIKGGKSVVDILVEENLATKVQKVLTGFVSNFNNLSDFFIQEVGCEENLEMTVNALTNAETFEPVSEVNENDLIAALYSDDGLWYRAKVIKQTENGTEVLFIDYGNSSISSEFRTLPPELAGKPALSKNCALQLPEGLEEWPKSANEKFMEISAEGCTQFDIKVITEGDPDVVSLHYNGNCVSEELKTFIDLIVTESTKTESASVGLTGYDKLVYISHINSPNDFYVQEDGAEIELDTLREVLTDVTSFESLEKITDDLKDKLFGALFVDDELWYRAKVMNHTSDGTEVLFVDYGNSAIASRFVKLPDTLEGKAPVALHCTLGEEDWSVEAKSCFVELGGEGTVPFGMKILKDSDPKLVSLATEGMIVKQKLLSFVNVEINENTAEVTSLSTELPANSEEENIIKTVFVIHVNSPNDFFLHTAEATQLLADISERLLAAEEFPLIEEESISKDKIVAAQFDEDDLWYRAKILDHKENETKVIFIDYGNSVNVAKVKELPDDLLKIPALAMNCALVKPGDGEWDSMASCETFNKLANEDGVSFDLKIVTEGEPNLVSLYINGESVAEQLIVASGMSPVKAITKEDEVDGSAEEKDKMVEDDDPLKQSEIENMLVNYVDGKISEKTHNEMKEVIEDIIYKSTMGPQEDVQQIVEDLISSAASSNLDDTAVAAEPEVDNVESLEIQEDNGECEKINEENEIKKDKVVDNSKSEKVQENNHEVSNSSYISNGVCEDQIKEQDDDRLTEDSNETTDNKSESESKGKKSPSTPRRHNVDDHIVPGCISSVKLNDSSEK